MRLTTLAAGAAVLCAALVYPCAAAGDRVPLTPGMIVNESPVGDPRGLVDEQDLAADPLATKPSTNWEGSWNQADYPLSAYIDFGREYDLGTLWLFDLNGEGVFRVYVGTPGDWTEVVREDCLAYQVWKEVRLRVRTRYIRFSKESPSANIAEVVLYTRPEVSPGIAERTLVDEVACASEPAEGAYEDYPVGISTVEDVLGRQCRCLPNDAGDTKYFAYVLGKGKGLRAGGAYVLEVDYPEDRPRSMFILNQGAETTLGLHTGATVGDVLHGKYTPSNPESLRIPLSGEFRTWRTLFFLHDRFPGIRRPRGEGDRSFVPADGFWVIVAQPKAAADPLSRGAAVSRIRLWAVPESELEVKLPEIPDGLPRRHIFAREEMADGVIASQDPTKRGVQDPTDWYEYKARLLRYLGMNTFCKDLLEFGSNQGWDSEPAGGNDWYYQTPTPRLWENILAMVPSYGLDVLPHYEYTGSKGYKGLGSEKRCKTLGGGDAYTHVTWCEAANADVTDPDTLVDVRKLLDCTIRPFAARVHFLGAWFRQRPSSLPISFSDRCLGLFAQERNGGAAVTRERLSADEALRAKYLAWWYDRRASFLRSARDLTRESAADPDAALLFTTDTSEGGVVYPDWQAPTVVTDDAPAWEALGERPIPLERAIAEMRQFTALTSDLLTWDKWEWQYSCPKADPERYRDDGGVMLTYTFNKAYTVEPPESMGAFRTRSGLAMVRHYYLNENEMDVGDDAPLGYFVSDVDLAGPYQMVAEARALAYGDPWWLGYLSASSFNRGFPEYARAFNLAFLSLPALPSCVVEGACTDTEVIVRAIDAGEHGTWLAIVNVALTAKPDVTVTLPTAGDVTDAVTGDPMPAGAGKVRLSLGPCEVRTARIRRVAAVAGT